MYTSKWGDKYKWGPPTDLTLIGLTSGHLSKKNNSLSDLSFLIREAAKKVLPLMAGPLRGGGEKDRP